MPHLWLTLSFMIEATANSIGRQIKLPLSKAVEIAWQSIRLRLGRSLLVTSGIVLALAFLMSIRIGCEQDK